MKEQELTGTWLEKPNRVAADAAAEYDALADTYDQDLPRWGWDTPEICAQMLSDHLSHEDTVLDVGCGTGLSGEQLRRAGFQYVDGADLSRKSLAIAEPKGIYRELFCCDLLQPLPWPADTYAGICCSGVLSNIPTADFLLEMCRIVRPSGVIVCSHREDLARQDDFEQRIEAMVGAGRWTVLEARRSVPYLHGKAEYADADLRAHYYALRVSDVGT